jgi:hypothetical protein
MVSSGGITQVAYVKLNGGLPTLPFKRVQSLRTADILAVAKTFYHVEDGRLVQRLSADVLVECGDEVEPGTQLLFDPKFYTLKCQFLTLNQTASLRLLAKRTSKLSGKMTGASRRVSKTVVEAEVHSTHNEVLETFFTALSSTEGIRIESGPTRTFDYGVLHGRFDIEPPSEDNKRGDGELSFDKEEDEKSSQSSLHFYS